MKLVMDTQVRLTEFKTSMKKKAFIDSLKTKNNYIELNDTTIFIWDHLGMLDNEKVFDSFCQIDNITLLLDSETQVFEVYRDGMKFDHVIFKEVSKWIKIKHDGDKRRLLRKMKKFREDFLDLKLNYTYYRGILSDKFSIFMKGKELLLPSWSKKDDINLLGIEENFSFFLKVCKLVL
jgi:hypothetical protein